jgi:hypothetical protein
MTGEAKDFLLVHRQKVIPTGQPVRIEQSAISILLNWLIRVNSISI